MLVKWTKFASAIDHGSRKFVLPQLDQKGIPIAQDLKPICKNAMHAILDVGRVQYEKALTNPSAHHGLQGRKGAESNRGKKMVEINES